MHLTCAAAGTGRDLGIDLFNAGPYASLISNVDFGLGSRLWGQVTTGTKATSYNTYWNMKAAVMVRAQLIMKCFTWVCVRVRRGEGQLVVEQLA